MAKYVKVITKRIVRVQVDRGASTHEFDVEGLAEAQKIVVALSQPEAFGIFALAKALQAADVEPNWEELPPPTMCSCGWPNRPVDQIQDDEGDDEDQGGDTSLAGAREADELADTVRMNIPAEFFGVDPRQRQAQVDARAEKHVARAQEEQAIQERHRHGPGCTHTFHTAEGAILTFGDGNEEDRS
jgi:hypothetical protein